MAGFSGNSILRIRQLFGAGQAAPSMADAARSAEPSQCSSGEDRSSPSRVPLRWALCIVPVGLEAALCGTIGVQGPALLHHPLVQARRLARATKHSPMRFLRKTLSAPRSVQRTSRLPTRSCKRSRAATPHVHAAPLSSMHVWSVCGASNAVEPVCHAIDDQRVAVGNQRSAVQPGVAATVSQAVIRARMTMPLRRGACTMGGGAMVPPRAAMKSRCLIRSPRRRGRA